MDVHGAAGWSPQTGMLSRGFTLQMQLFASRSCFCFTHFALHRRAETLVFNSTQFVEDERNGGAQRRKLTFFRVGFGTLPLCHFLLNGAVLSSRNHQRVC